jgi:hypothetical protein
VSSRDRQSVPQEHAANALDNLPAGLTDDERRCCEQLDFIWKHVAYAIEMGTRPQSLTALADWGREWRPVGRATGYVRPVTAGRAAGEKARNLPWAFRLWAGGEARPFHHSGHRSIHE